jgi:hypothetical protein
LHGAYPAVGQATINNVTNGPYPFNGPVGGAHNVVFGQDISTFGIIGGIGQGFGAGNVATDPLRNGAYDNWAVLLSGTFPGGSTAATLPRFAPLSGGTITDGNVLASTTPGMAAVDATVNAVNLRVRGDALVDFNLNSAPGQGLLRGDVTRDFKVDGDDLAQVLLRFNDPGVFTWDQGDVTDDGIVNGADLAEVLLRYNDSSVPPGLSPAIAPASEAISAAIAFGSADFDANGQVDGRDLLIWHRGVGTPSGATKSQGDANGDGAVNGADLTMWRSQSGFNNVANAVDDVFVAVAAVGLPGDNDFNGVVDGEDLLGWQQGQSPSRLSANDLADWRNYFGESVAATASSSAVPEPHAVGLMILGTFTLDAGCRRRRPRPN